MKKRVVLILCILLLIPVLLPHAAATQTWEGDAREVMNISNVQNSMTFDCKSVVLMEANTGTVLYAQNPDEALPPASVTKIMTLLLVMEALDSGKIQLTDTGTGQGFHRITAYATQAENGHPGVAKLFQAVSTQKQLRAGILICHGYTCAIACCRSAIRSFASSRPQLRRMRSAPTPAASSSASVICR